jgi:hypothetical protein
VGDEYGKLFLYNVHEQLYNARTTEWEDFAGYV